MPDLFQRRGASRRVTEVGLATLMATGGCSTRGDGAAPATTADPAPGVTSPPTSSTTAPTTSPPEAQPPIVDLAGRYTIEDGTSADGSGGYTGEVAISRDGEVHRLSWTIPGTAAQSGVALVEGKVLATGYGPGTGHGVAVYRISGGALAGRWANASMGAGVGTEDLVGPDGLNGRYTSSGRQPGLTGYTGTVDIRPTGKTYAVARTSPNGRISAVGIRTGELLVVGWCGGVVTYAVDGSRLQGPWALLGDDAVGTELLRRRA